MKTAEKKTEIHHNANGTTNIDTWHKWIATTDMEGKEAVIQKISGGNLYIIRKKMTTLSVNHDNDPPKWIKKAGYICIIVGIILMIICIYLKLK